ncbi:hypothetical protein COOONC_08110 [Cooperia oncophora]
MSASVNYISYQKFMGEPFQAQPPQQFWNWAPPTVPTIIPTTPSPPIATLPPLEITPANPKLLAHNAARMIREIATFSDVHHGSSGGYDAVQSIMEAFFESVADPKSASALQFNSAISMSIELLRHFDRLPVTCTEVRPRIPVFDYGAWNP